MKKSRPVNTSEEAFDAFIDDCLLTGDPICNEAHRIYHQIKMPNLSQDSSNIHPFTTP